MKKIYLSLAAVLAALTLTVVSTSAFACGGNQCSGGWGGDQEITINLGSFAATQNWGGDKGFSKTEVFGNGGIWFSDQKENQGQAGEAGFEYFSKQMGFGPGEQVTTGMGGATGMFKWLGSNAHGGGFPHH